MIKILTVPILSGPEYLAKNYLYQFTIAGLDGNIRANERTWFRWIGYIVHFPGHNDRCSKTKNIGQRQYAAISLYLDAVGKFLVNKSPSNLSEPG